MEDRVITIDCAEEIGLQSTEEAEESDKERGFSLVELMVSVAIIAVIAAVAVPIYTNQSQRTYIAEVQGDLLDCGQSLERLASREWSYSAGDAGGGLVAAAVCDPASVRSGRYTMAINADRDGFTLTATPVVDGAMDDSGIVSIDQAGNQVWDEAGDGVDEHDRNWTPHDGS